jgi:hypothetical protein
MKTPAAQPRTINVVKRLSAPTTLAYELGAIAFGTVALPLIMLGFKVMTH